MEIPTKIQATKQDPRFQRGRRMIEEKRYEEGIEIFGDCLHTMEETSTSSIPDLSLAPIYYEYGNVLLFNVESTAGVFGSELEQTEEKEDATNDMQLAWEMLEVARLIYSQYTGEIIENELSKVYLRLGDIGMESGQYQQSKEDYQRSMGLTMKTWKEGDIPNKSIADLHCCMAMACVYQSYTDTGLDATAKLQLLEEGLQHYLSAGDVFYQVIMAQTAALSPQMKQLIEKVMPPKVESTGKGKQKQESKTLDFKGDITTFTGEFKALLSTEQQDEEAYKALLDNVEIYVELKEKADGVVADMTATPVSKQEEDTQIGFGENKENAKQDVATLVPVVKKKRKAEGTATAPGTKKQST